VYPPVPIVYEPSPTVGDLADRLMEQRTVLVTGPLELAVATEASARLMLLDGTGDDPIDIVLSCPDGDLLAAMALADTIELVGVELRAVCSGTIGGAALLPYALATRRLAQPHATFRLTKPRHEAQGRASDLAAEAAHHADLVTDLVHRLADATGQTFETVDGDFERNRLLTAQEAMAYGLVDEIVHRRGLRTVTDSTQ
jgi:ATP-dependent Clp protease protease subunit